MQLMAVKIKFFGKISDDVASKESSIDIAEPIDIVALWERLLPHHAMPANILIAKNHQFVTKTCLVEGDDEVAFMSPVTGG